MKETEAEIKALVDDARERIQDVMDNGPGEYDHNIISATLRILSSKVGTRYSDELVEELGLTELYSIPTMGAK